MLYSTRNGGGWVAPIQLKRASELPAYGSVDAALRLGGNELDVVWLGSNPGNPNVLLNFADVGSTLDIYPPTVAINSPVPGDILSIGNQATVTWAATDNVGVTAVDVSCTFMVTVNDTEKPSITCPAAANVGCFVDIPSPNTSAVTASDNCGVVSKSFVGDSIATNGCMMTVTRIYQAVDGWNNTNICAQTITVRDTTAPTVTLGNLAHVYDGTAKIARATTTPVGLTTSLTYNGSASAPTNAASYQVIGTVVDANYTGSATNTLVIS